METPPLPPDFRAFLALLNDHGVDYLLIGGYAVIAHGHFRATKDMDIWLRPEPANAQRMMDVIKAFYGSTQGIDINSFLDPQKVFFMGVEPNRIDVLNDIPGVMFDPCFRQSVTVDLGDIEVPLIDVWSLIKNKRASGRPQDIADAHKLEALYRNQP